MTNQNKQTLFSYQMDLSNHASFLLEKDAVCVIASADYNHPLPDGIKLTGTPLLINDYNNLIVKWLAVEVSYSTFAMKRSIKDPRGLFNIKTICTCFNLDLYLVMREKCDITDEQIKYIKPLFSEFFDGISNDHTLTNAIANLVGIKFNKEEILEILIKGYHHGYRIPTPHMSNWVNAEIYKVLFAVVYIFSSNLLLLEQILRITEEHKDKKISFICGYKGMDFLSNMIESNMGNQPAKEQEKQYLIKIAEHFDMFVRLKANQNNIELMF